MDLSKFTGDQKKQIAASFLEWTRRNKPEQYEQVKRDRPEWVAAAGLEETSDGSDEDIH